MKDLGAKLFTFAVIADSHLNPEEDVSSSPYATNRLANARARTVVRQLNAAMPAFVLHLGDIVHPVPKLASYADAAARFRELFAELEPRLLLIPGNHDVGDKPVAWAPAGIVCEPWIALYREHFGPDYQTFDFGGVHFVLIDAQVLNSGLPTEAAQRAWLEADLAEHHGERVILATHYPPFVAERDEPSSYDNVDEPARSWLLDLCAKHRVEAIYAGHVHNFFWDQCDGTDLAILPSTALVRVDYSELFRAAPADDAERGRNDYPKLGYLLVDVHERGRVDRLVRTHGVTTKKADAASTKHRLTPLFGPVASFGLDLRHPWAELVDIPPSGALEDFARKRARNDYPLLAILELGAKGLRVPVEDLVDARVRRRMRLLVDRGHRFTAVTYGVPDARLEAALAEHHA
ncbi:MAG TPA: metallophosphoesterase, partial [Byssovorax sp.]